MAKKPQVKCPVCMEQFYREENEYVQLGRRYYHKECYESMEEEQRIIQEIHEKMRQTLGNLYIKQKVTKQVKDYLDEGKTAQGILDTIKYWFDVRKEDATKSAGGIGIVGYIYNEAQKYWNEKEMRESRNKDIDLSCFDEPVVYTITPTPIRKPKRVKLFNLD